MTCGPAKQRRFCIFGCYLAILVYQVFQNKPYGQGLVILVTLSPNVGVGELFLEYTLQVSRVVLSLVTLMGIV